MGNPNSCWIFKLRYLQQDILTKIHVGVKTWPKKRIVWHKGQVLLNKILNKSLRPNGLEIFKVSVPLGVVSVIFESRPNVASDVAALCIKSGNSVILKGGKEAKHTTEYLIRLIKKELRKTLKIHFLE